MASLPVNDGLHKDLKVDVAENDVTMKEVVNDLVESYLDGEVEVDL